MSECGHTHTHTQPDRQHIPPHAAAAAQDNADKATRQPERATANKKQKLAAVRQPSQRRLLRLIET